MKNVTINTLMTWKQEGRKFATSTAYDASFAQLFQEQEMPLLLVGDSFAVLCLLLSSSITPKVFRVLCLQCVSM